MITLVGTIGAIASVASFTPQAWKIIRDRSTDGLSASMYALTCLSFAMWMTFGILNGEWTMIIPNALCLASALFIFVLIMLPQEKTAEIAKDLKPDE